MSTDRVATVPGRRSKGRRREDADVSADFGALVEELASVGEGR